MTPDAEDHRGPAQQALPEQDFKIIDFGRILRYMGLALLTMAVLGGLLVAVAYLLVR